MFSHRALTPARILVSEGSNARPPPPIPILLDDTLTRPRNPADKGIFFCCLRPPCCSTWCYFQRSLYSIPRPPPPRFLLSFVAYFTALQNTKLRLDEAPTASKRLKSVDTAASRRHFLSHCLPKLRQTSAVEEEKRRKIPQTACGKKADREGEERNSALSQLLQRTTNLTLELLTAGQAGTDCVLPCLVDFFFSF